MITIIFFVAVGIATFHFIYEGILAPSLRLSLRFRIFRLRDELRRFAVGPEPRIADEEFRRHQERLNNAINILRHINVVDVIEASRALERDTKLLEETKTRVALLEKSESREAVHIYQQTNEILLNALWISCGGWFLYMLPIGLVFFGIDRIRAFIQEFPTLPEAEIERIAPRLRGSAAA